MVWPGRIIAQGSAREMAEGWGLLTAARTIWMEARDQGAAGQKAIAHTIVNRVRDGRWGTTLHEVCTSEYKGWHQFSGWNRGDSNRVPAIRLHDEDPALVQYSAYVTAALNGEADPTGGATHYYNPDIAEQPEWVRGNAAKKIPPATFCCRIGKHLFYKGVA